MTIFHIVLVEFKPDVNQAIIDNLCNELLALATQCVHPETQKSYIRSITGGKNSNEEPVRAPYSYGFIVEFENEGDRQFYLKKDPVHSDFAGSLKKVAQSVGTFDYVPGVF